MPNEAAFPDENPACGAPVEKADAQEVDVFAATQAGIETEPEQPPNAFLILRSGERAGRRFKLAQKQVIGRENGEIIIRDPRMSRQHASLEMFGREFLLRDLGSANHTFVNNEMIQQPILIKHGDRVRLGNTEFEFIIEEK
jgi:pSer/pThr/pTyr-binding forkhead associated (FHA) protein